ncbi:MAG TPA: L-fucose:H+ symporter permease [Candidatus Saccharimonadales bacterium]|nr:L-fucose:H+ symporter permease [Candidatus Saccharimonadales bacterium]
MTVEQPAPPELNQSIPVTERKYLVPMVLITSLFFLWAIGVNLNDVLIPHFKKIFVLTDFQSSLIQIAFFGGYCLAALPAGWLMGRIGYKRGILAGLFLCASGALLFVPAASASVYLYFLVALFVMACGQSFLEVAANPYVTVLGPAESAARRLNLAQSFNAVGALITPVLGARFILTANEFSLAQIPAMTAEQLQAFRVAEAHTVKAPYLVIAGIFVLVAVMIYFTNLPEIHEPGDGYDSAASRKGISGALAHPQLVRGTIAQFFYVGAQVGVASFVIRFAQHIQPGLSSKSAANYLKFHLLGFVIGRFLGSAIMKRIPAPRLLSVFAAGALVCTCVAISFSSAVSIWAVVLLGFFHSIMFPTIFALGIRNLGGYTKIGSSFLVMAIIGGAFFPGIMGYISDATNMQRAFSVPLVCYAFVLYFGLQGYKSTSTDSPQEPRTINA